LFVSFAGAVLGLLGGVPEMRAASFGLAGTGRRVDASGFVEGLGVIGTQDGRTQLPSTVGVIRLEAPLAKTFAAHLELRGHVGGPYRDVHAGFHDFVHAFQDYSPGVEVGEGYVDFRMARLAARLGIQDFAWGRLDGVPPTDVLNPRDLHDPFVEEVEDAKIGVPALRLTGDLPGVRAFALDRLRAELAYVPLAVPSRLALEDERWFPPAVRPPPVIHLPAQDAELILEKGLVKVCEGPPRQRPKNCALLGDEDIVVPNAVDVQTTLRTSNHRPPLTFGAGGVGLRLSGSWLERDWSVYHYTGPETGPDATVSGQLTATVTPEEARRVDISHARAQLDVRQAHATIHMTGADFAAPAGPVTLRGEAAFFQGRPYLRSIADLFSPAALRRVQFNGALARRALNMFPYPCRQCSGHFVPDALFSTEDSVEWGVSVDTLQRGVFALLQLNQIVLLDAAPRLLIADPETRVTAFLRRGFLQDQLEVEVRAIYGIDRPTWVVFPRVSYLVTDSWRARVGYLAVSGARESLYGQFAANDEVVLQLRHSF
jgi:hypothetical protein